MAETVSSAVAQEVVSRVLSGIKERYERESKVKEHIERMEIANIKLNTALKTSEKWNITSVPLLRWRRKLKRVAQECDDTLLSCMQRLKEEEEFKNGVGRSSFPKRILHNVSRLLVSSIFNNGNEEPNGSTVRRFEWFADGASEFLRYMEIGGMPSGYMFFDPPVRHLLGGKGTKYCLVRGDQHLLLFLRPFSLPGYGTEARLILLLQDGNAPENNFILGLHLRLTESTDVVGVTVRCMQLFTSHLTSTAETVKAELTQLPTQDFYWMPYDFSISSRKEHWDDLHTIFCKWFRQNPLCCQHQQHDHHYAQRYAGSSIGSLTRDVYLEQVTQVYLQGYVALSSTSYKRRRAITNSETWSTRDFSHLKLSGLFSPHASSEDLSLAVGGSATQMINGETKHCGSYENISFEQLGEIMLPNAVDCLRVRAADTSYQMLWKSKHGGAYFRVKKTSWRAANSKGRGEKLQKLRGKDVQGWTCEITEFIDSWVAYAPAPLQGPISDWVWKEKQMPPIQEEMTPTE